MQRRDSLGRFCLDLSATARPLPSNEKLYDHVVVIQNRCLQRIKVKVCYFKSDRCFLVEVPANQRRDTILGTFPNLKYFRYEYQEQP